MKECQNKLQGAKGVEEECKGQKLHCGKVLPVILKNMMVFVFLKGKFKKKKFSYNILWLLNVKSL